MFQVPNCLSVECRRHAAMPVYAHVMSDGFLIDHRTLGGRALARISAQLGL